MRCENEFSLHGIYCYVKLGGTFNVVLHFQCTDAIYLAVVLITMVYYVKPAFEEAIAFAKKDIFPAQ